MFTVTSERLGTVAGEVEYPAVAKTEEGIQVTLKGLSPVSVAWKVPAATATTPDTGDENVTLWLVLLLVGAVVSVNMIIAARRHVL